MAGATLVPRLNFPHMNQNNAVTVSPVTVRGVKRWRVRYHENGRVKRAHFSARDSADSHAAKLRSEAVGAQKAGDPAATEAGSVGAAQ